MSANHKYRINYGNGQVHYCANLHDLKHHLRHADGYAYGERRYIDPDTLEVFWVRTKEQRT
jgi:hypothetical protein